MGYIYKITNTVNGKVYIGQTIKTPSERFRQHKYCATHKKHQRGHLHRAMAKYGCDNFTIEVVEKCPRNRLDEREVYWIEQYDSFNNGYNLTLGGGGTKVNCDTDIILSLWDSGLAIADISKAIGRKRNHISTELKASGIADEEISERGYQSLSKRNSPPVYQYDLQGNFIAEFATLAEVENALGIRKQQIKNARCGITKVAGGFQWRPYKVDNIGVDANKYNMSPKKVYCLETDTTYRSLKKAQEDTGVDRHIIKLYIEGKRKDDKFHFSFV